MSIPVACKIDIFNCKISLSRENVILEKITYSRIRVNREVGLIEKNKVEQLALEQMGYRAIRNRENGMTPTPINDVKQI